MLQFNLLFLLASRTGIEPVSVTCKTYGVL